jgi:hypothetical protein
VATALTQKRPRFAVLAVSATLITSGGVAKAQSDEEEPQPPPEPPAQTPVKAEEPAPATMASAPRAQPEGSALFLEEMGPQTFPGRLRGIEGGSLWLEPSFHGLQWPRNTRTGIAVSGNVWIDGGYETIRRDPKDMPNSSAYLEQGRGVLRVTPAFVAGRLFFQSQVELVGNLCQAANASCTGGGTFTTDDLWLRVGAWNLWDLKVGRFEGWEVYHLGMGMDPYTLERMGAGMWGVDNNTASKLDAPTLYGVNYMHDRPSEGLGVGYAALHFYPWEFLRLELLAKMGYDNYRDDNSTGDTNYTYLGGRPTAILDLGWLKLKVGAEYQTRTPVSQTVVSSQDKPEKYKKDAVKGRTQMGVGGSLQFVLNPFVEFGFNVAAGKQSDTDGFGRDEPASSYTTKSYGGFANGRLIDGLLLGVGVNYTTWLDLYEDTTTNSRADDYTSHLQGFVALQYMLARQIFIKLVTAYAQAEFQPSETTVPLWKNHMYSARVRLMYLY